MQNKKNSWLEETIKVCEEASLSLKKVREDLIREVNANWQYVKRLDGDSSKKGNPIYLP